MKTTIEISDALMADARRAAERRGTTLRALVEEGLRHVVKNERRKRTFRLRQAEFKGDGLDPAFAADHWDRIRDAAYAGRGA